MKPRIDLMIQDRVVGELKAIESLAPIHEALVFSYRRLSGPSLGLLIRFKVNALKDEIRRYII